MDERVIGSILEKEPPAAREDFIGRVRFCAEALAFGASQDLWEPKFWELSDNLWSPYSQGDDYTKRFNDYFNNNEATASNGDVPAIWKKNYPRVSFLESFGYVERFTTMVSKTENRAYYILTPKAYQLLDDISSKPKIFISYKRGISTEFALLLESRLKEKQLNPFVDKNIPAGAIWENHIREMINESDTFICLIGRVWEKQKDDKFIRKNSLSGFVLEEIKQAASQNAKLISIWHGDFAEQEFGLCADAELRDYLSSRHSILVKGQTTLDYEAAIIQLMSDLHYF